MRALRGIGVRTFPGIEMSQALVPVVSFASMVQNGLQAILTEQQSSQEA